MFYVCSSPSVFFIEGPACPLIFVDFQLGLVICVIGLHYLSAGFHRLSLSFSVHASIFIVFSPCVSDLQLFSVFSIHFITNVDTKTTCTNHANIYIYISCVTYLKCGHVCLSWWFQQAVLKTNMAPQTHKRGHLPTNWTYVNPQHVLTQHGIGQHNNPRWFNVDTAIFMFMGVYWIHSVSLISIKFGWLFVELH